MRQAFLLAGGLIGAASLLTPGSAGAQDIANGVLRCSAVEGDAARLRCFEGLVPQARKSADERKAEAAAQAKADFGLTAVQRSERSEREHPEREERERVAREDELRVEAAIAELEMSPYGTTFALDNGQVWRTTSFGGLNTVPRVGQKVTIEPGSLGGYRLTLEGKKREVGVTRVK